MNNIVISGKLGRNPELSYTPKTQTACARLSVAVKGEKRDDAPTWLRVTVWGKQAETCNQYLTKGQEVIVQGSLRISKGQDGKEHTEVVANKVEFGAKPQVPANPETTFAPIAEQVPNEPAMQIGFSAVDDACPF